MLRPSNEKKSRVLNPSISKSIKFSFPYTCTKVDGYTHDEEVRPVEKKH